MEGSQAQIASESASGRSVVPVPCVVCTPETRQADIQLRNILQELKLKKQQVEKTHPEIFQDELKIEKSADGLAFLLNFLYEEKIVASGFARCHHRLVIDLFVSLMECEEKVANVVAKLVLQATVQRQYELDVLRNQIREISTFLANGLTQKAVKDGQEEIKSSASGNAPLPRKHQGQINMPPTAKPLLKHRTLLSELQKYKVTEPVQSAYQSASQGSQLYPQNMGHSLSQQTYLMPPSNPHSYASPQQYPNFMADYSVQKNNHYFQQHRSQEMAARQPQPQYPSQVYPQAQPSYQLCYMPVMQPNHGYAPPPPPDRQHQ